MSIPQVLEVAVGLIVIYYILGSVVSLVTQWINEFFESRGRALEQYLIKIIGNKRIGDFKNLPQMQALRPIRYKGFLSVFGSDTEPKMIEKIPVATLVDAYFDMAGLTANKELELLQLAELVDKLPESDGKAAFISWINQGVTNIADLRTRTTAYFTGLMEQAASTFRARSRSFVIILSIGITLLFGTDTIQLAQALWTNAELRTIAAAQADAVVAEGGTTADLSDLVDQLSQFSIKIGWWQTQQFPQTNNIGAWALYIFLKALGFALTAAAVSQGASFWYDLLKKLSSPATSSSTGSRISEGSSTSITTSSTSSG
ncbi:MAG: hypothetical protein H7Y59_08605 [Anaerolineales bacterium]|nr:hypothetical protein [Anaerolineales bacterium]